MTPFIRELIPLLFLFAAGLSWSCFGLLRSMHEWFSKTGSDEYLGYSLNWYLVTPIMFCVGWYGSIIVGIVLLNLWYWIKG